ncbi:MAG: hypothetical protein CMM39_13040 [Rhodospirillaceae bacterium]|nr:hypothetical protein [Rhodospirillaceae bacterium]
MNNVLLAALFLIFGLSWSQTSHSMDLSSSQLMASCSSAQSEEQAFCIGYIGGVLAGSKTTQKISGGTVFKHSASGVSWCKPEKQNLIEATNIIVKFFHGNKSNDKTNALMLVIGALEIEWPCDNK